MIDLGVILSVVRSREHIFPFSDMFVSFVQYTSFSAFANYTSGEGANEQWDLGYTGARSGSYLLHPSDDTPLPVVDLIGCC